MSITRRDHSRTEACTKVRSRSRETSNREIRVAASTPMNTAKNSCPNSELGHRDGRHLQIPCALSGGLDTNPNDVPLSVDGLYDLRGTCIISQQLPQAAHAHIDAAILGISLAATQQSGQLRA
jgi:hypothetical protein